MTTATEKKQQLKQVFDAYRPILEPYVAGMIAVQNNDHGIYLNTHTIMKNKQPLFFAALAINKNYVSFHVFPVYMYPDLLDGIGDLKKRMQGKSCFNFSKVDPDQVARMEAMVKAGFDRFKAEGDI